MSEQPNSPKFFKTNMQPYQRNSKTPNPQTKKSLADSKIEKSKSEIAQNSTAYSLHSFILEFNELQSYNNTDLLFLGLDFKSTEPLLKTTTSIIEDYPCSYRFQQKKIRLFEIKTLFYMFYTQREDIQLLAAKQLMKRGYTYSKEDNVWSKDDEYFDVENWCFEKKE